MTRTQWFTDENPVHVGWYERNYRSLVEGTSLVSIIPISMFVDLSPDYWDGSAWYQGDGSGTAVADDDIFIPWRGLEAMP
jgi:hypothetical protein